MSLRKLWEPRDGFPTIKEALIAAELGFEAIVHCGTCVHGYPQNKDGCPFEADTWETAKGVIVQSTCSQNKTIYRKKTKGAIDVQGDSEEDWDDI